MIPTSLHTKKWTDLELDPALIVGTLTHGDVVVRRSLPLDLAHRARVFERAPLQDNLWSLCGDDGIKSDGGGDAVGVSFP